jgi:hypothetical protein
MFYSRTNFHSNCAGVLFQHLFHKVFMIDEAWRETETGVCVFFSSPFVYFYPIFITLILDCDSSQKSYWQKHVICRHFSLEARCLRKTWISVIKYLLICTNECTIFWLKYYTNISLLYNYTCSYMFRPLKVIPREPRKFPIKLLSTFLKLL